MIVGIAGFKGAGKGTVADILVKHGFVKVSFATKLKDMVATLFNWPRHLLEGNTEEGRKWREQPDDKWAQLAGTGIFKDNSEITPRCVLQRFGTDLFRNHVQENFWVLMLQSYIQSIGSPYIVIDDCREGNELNICNYRIRVVRNGTENMSHVSETAHLSYSYNYVLDNNGSIAELETEIVNKILPLLM